MLKVSVTVGGVEGAARPSTHKLKLVVEIPIMESRPPPPPPPDAATEEGGWGVHSGRIPRESSKDRSTMNSGDAV